MEKFIDAIDLFDKAIMLNPNCFEAYYNKGQLKKIKLRNFS